MTNPVFCLEDGLIRDGEREIMLSPQRAAILGVLRKHQPHYVSVKRLSADIWPGGLPSGPSDSLSVQISRMRRQLEGLSVLVESRNGYGYRLVGELTVE